MTGSPTGGGMFPLSVNVNELQVWFLAEHVVDGPLVHADEGPNGR